MIKQPKRILILTHVIQPFISPRSFRGTELAKELARQGHQVTLYANLGNANVSELREHYGIDVRNYRKFRFVKKVSSPHTEYGLFDKLLIKCLHKAIYYPNIEFLFNIGNSIPQNETYDLLISIASPHSIHWGTAYTLKRRPALTKVWIADCGDPFWGNKFFKFPFYFKYIERWAFKYANYITIPTTEAKLAYLEEVRKKILVIPQGFNFTNVKLAAYTPNTIPTFAFAGALYKGKRDPHLFLDYLKSLNRPFKFILYTTSHSVIHSYIHEFDNKIEVRNYIPREKLLFELSKMDFLVNVENLFLVQSPSKLIDYSITGRPILSINNTVLDKTAIDEFLMGNYSKKLTIDTKQYEITNVVNKFVLAADNAIPKIS